MGRNRKGYHILEDRGQRDFRRELGERREKGVERAWKNLREMNGAENREREGGNDTVWQQLVRR